MTDEKANIDQAFGPEFQARLSHQLQAMNMARSLLTPHERQVLDVYYDGLRKRIDPALSGNSQDLEQTINSAPKPAEFDQIEAKLADLYNTILTSGLSKVNK